MNLIKLNRTNNQNGPWIQAQNGIIPVSIHWNISLGVGFRGSKLEKLLIQLKNFALATIISIWYFKSEFISK